MRDEIISLEISKFELLYIEIFDLKIDFVCWLVFLYICGCFSFLNLGPTKQEVSVDALMQRMRNLSQNQNECSETELNDRFKTVEMQVRLKLCLQLTSLSSIFFPFFKYI